MQPSAALNELVPCIPHCTSSREGKFMLSCSIPEHLRQELDCFWAEQGLRPHGRTQQGMERMIRDYLAPGQST